MPKKQTHKKQEAAKPERKQSDTKTQLKERRKLLFFAVISAILLGALIALIIVRNDTSQVSTSTPKAIQPAPANKDFAPVSTKDQSYIVNIVPDDDSSTTASTLSYDGNGTSRYDYTADGQHTTIYYTKDSYYLCSGDEQCIQYPLTQSSDSGFDPAFYQFDTAKVDSLKATASYQGYAPCPAGTCDVWTFASQNGTTRICTDLKTGKLSFIEVTTADKTTKATYTYQKVTIVPPADAVSASSL